MFLHAGGTVIRKELENDELTLQCGCLVRRRTRKGRTRKGWYLVASYVPEEPEHRSCSREGLPPGLPCPR